MCKSKSKSDILDIDTAINNMDLRARADTHNDSSAKKFKGTKAEEPELEEH